MAVSETITLPDQPGAGQNFQQPLGGDGWRAPSSVHEVHVELPGDVSGGNSTIAVNFDPRYMGIVTYVRMTNEGASAAVELLLTLQPASPRTNPQAQAFGNAVPVMSLSTANVMTWCPPPIPHFRRLKSTKTNVDGDTHVLDFYLYNFNIRALEIIPLNIILASLPRADSQFPTTAS